MIISILSLRHLVTRRSLLLLIFASFLTLPALVLAQVEWDHGDPSTEEQLLLEWINRARAWPPLEGDRLADTQDSLVETHVVVLGINLEEIRNDFYGYPPRQPLAFNPLLNNAAEVQTDHQIATDEQSHVGPGGSALRQRVEGAGLMTWRRIGENVFAQTRSLLHGHSAFQYSVGHRSNLMNFDEQLPYSEIGLSLKATPDGERETGPLVLTQVFARTYDQADQFSPWVDRYFLLGVVYEDLDGDGMYSRNEGLSEVRIDVDGAGFYAITNEAGGYAFPLNGVSGRVTATAMGGELGATQTRSIVVEGLNAKLDFTKGSVLSKSLWQYLTADIDGFKHTDWFGQLEDGYYPFVSHLEHGWIYVIAEDEESVFFYDFVLGWVWTGRSVPGWYYRFGHDGGDTPGWVYHLPGTFSPNRQFDDFSVLPNVRRPESDFAPLP